MKKRLTLTILVMSIALAGHAQLVKFGLTAGGNINQMKLDKEVINEENFTGFFVGATIDISLPLPGLSAEGSVLYDRRSVNVLGEDDHIDYIDVPLNAKYSIGLGSLGSIYGATGPQFSFNIGDDNIFNHKYELSPISIALSSTSFLSGPLKYISCFIPAMPSSDTQFTPILEGLIPPQELDIPVTMSSPLLATPVIVRSHAPNVISAKADVVKAAAAATAIRVFFIS